MSSDLPDIDLDLTDDEESAGEGAESACAVDLEDELGFDPTDLDRPLLIWDGTCGFCKRSVERVRDEVGDRIRVAPYQKVHHHFEDIDEEDFANAVHLVEPDGTYCRAAEAIFRSLAMAPGGGIAQTGWLWAYLNVPGFRALTEWGYKQVAEHRPLVSKTSRWFIGESLRPSRWSISRWLFLRGLALVALIAFLSLSVQIGGLAGPDGIAPALDVMNNLREVAGEKGSLWTVLHHPTLYWLVDPGGGVLLGTCIGGAILAGLLFIGVWPRLTIGLTWATYLSLATVCRPFLNYQWDALLLEALFLAIFIAPRGAWPSWRPERVSRAAVFLLHWLAFRLMFMSGMVKLLSNDATWWNFTALRYHFWTQPLPAWTSWWAYQAPGFVLDAATFLVLALELVVPLLILGPRRPRRWAAAALAALQVAIVLTGNFGFFNILSIVVFVLLIDDAIWREWLPTGGIGSLDKDPPAHRLTPRPTRARIAAWAVLIAGVLLLTGFNMAQRFAAMNSPGRNPLGAPAAVQKTLGAIGQYRSLNNYGLFADMTERRPELLIEGSRDGETWQAYKFPWKPGEIDARPPLVGPHMPRLDWQMWFQGLRWMRVHDKLDRCGWSSWYVAFQQKLLEGEPAVLDLLERNPFEGEPPRYLRTTVWHYRFTQLGGPEADRWWSRERKGTYCPTLTLEEGELTPVRRPATSAAN